MVPAEPPAPPFLASLPDSVRQAHLAALSVLAGTTWVRARIILGSLEMGASTEEDRDLFKAIGLLRESMRAHEKAVRAAIPALARTRGFEPFQLRGQTSATAHSAALDYARRVLFAVDTATPAGAALGIDSEEAGSEATGASEDFRRLSACGDKTADGEPIAPGSRWQAFCERCLDAMPDDIGRELHAALELEVARLSDGNRPEEGVPARAEATEQGEEWLPASEAVERAERLHLPAVTLPWLSKSANGSGVRTRRREQPGRHKLEVEWNSLAGHLTRKALAADESEDPESTDARIREAHAQRRQSRPIE